ncbi:Skb1 methyltransferase [Hesseltinella vesiculosa]|uniref:Protein arginine N-methyltransferase n=1 Tax=Hesseltinella vesiculosa TaxID=101127 RepID=A0A1X2G3Z1_9FUNG|nr:Skb1 methyltransferase [Hesseltinella vesiculosa]
MAQRACPVGLLATDYYDNIHTFIDEASEDGHDFVASPLAHPSFRRFIEGTEEIDAMNSWRDSPVFQRKDLIVKSPKYSDLLVGVLAAWYRFDSPDHELQLNSELALKQELAWASHLGLLSVMLPVLPEKNVTNMARVLNNTMASISYTQLWIKVPVTSKEGGESPWKLWNRIRTLTEHSTKIHVALELTKDLPDDDELDRWLAEPVKALIVPHDVFVANPKQYPVLPKPHQDFVKIVMDKLRPNILVTLPEVPSFQNASPVTYHEYIRFLNRNLPELDAVDSFAAGYRDYLQAPLQPLMDNLDNSTYETFERDPIKYQQYEEAVYRALLDRDPDATKKTVVMVVGAGRGPLVDCCLRASERSKRDIHLYALEKNPNAFVTLQNKKEEEWQDKVELIFADMRTWKPSHQTDILVSELLGSFGDNELSPECLDGAQKFLKDDGISIPAAYTAYCAPLSSTKLHNEVASYKDLEHFETPYVVMFQQVCALADSKPLWTFDHPNPVFPCTPEGNPVNNLHNTRYQQVTFDVAKPMTMHGLAGYFESVLYKDVMISIHPDTHSPGMFSWFPIFFPLQSPVQVPAGAQVVVDFWRLSDKKKIWYEWAVVVKNKNDQQDLSITAIHNPQGRSYWVGL